VTVHDQWWERADGKGATLLRRHKGNAAPLRPGLPLPSHLPSMDNGDELTPTECGESGPVAQDYVWVASLPTDPVRLRRALRSSFGDKGDDGPEMRWQVITDALRRGITSPKLLAALFRLAAEIPGARVIPNLRDDLGRPATGIQYVTRLDPADAPQTEQLILDARTLRYLGSRTVAGEPRAGLVRGTVLSSSMLVKLDVTDRLPRLERGTRLARC
jgi:hypothetical protein